MAIRAADVASVIGKIASMSNGRCMAKQQPGSTPSSLPRSTAAQMPRDSVVQATNSSSSIGDPFLRVRIRCNVRRCILSRRAVSDTLRPLAS
jgi:hypothetical protein